MTSIRFSFVFALLIAMSLPACEEQASLPSPGARGARPDTPLGAAGKADGALIASRGVTGAAWRRDFVTGTPTYGHPATDTFVRLAVVVEDAELQSEYAAFDGFEHVFALVPRRGSDGVVIWEGHNLPYRYTSHHGYCGEKRSDRHETEWLPDLDVETIMELGVAFGMDTNVGLVWLQQPNENFPLQD